MSIGYESAGPGKRGATRINWMEGRPHKLLREIMLANPTATEARLQVLFEDKMRDEIKPEGDIDLLDALIVYFFTNRHTVIKAEIAQATERQKPVAENKSTAQKRQEFKEKVEKTVAAVEQVILLNQEMPNGKRRRNCNRKELMRFSKFDAALARKLKNDHELLGSVVNEKEARAVLNSILKA